MSRSPVASDTFLYAEVDGLTYVRRHLGGRSRDALAEYERLVRMAAQVRDGCEVGRREAAVLFGFHRPRDAIAAAVAAQRALATTSWYGIAAHARAAFPEQPMGRLSSRERVVATLIARGLTNREIASVLMIAERTAETHVQHIFNKLGLNSRSQVAAWIVEHGFQATSADETPRMAPLQDSHGLRS